MDASYWGTAGRNFVSSSHKDIIFTFLYDLSWLTFLLHGNLCYNFTSLGSISKGESVSDGATKKNQFSILKGESMLHPANDFEPVRRGFKNYYKECMSSLIISSPRNLSVFKRQFFPEYYTQRAKTFSVLSFTSSLTAWSYVISTAMPSVRGAVR